MNNWIILLFAVFPVIAESAKSSGFEGWVRTELASGKDTIVLPQGTHHASAANASQRTLHISNNDDGMKQVLFDLEGREDLVIDGNGAELILHGHIIPFYLKNTRNITIKNLTIDWEHPFFSQGDIVRVGDGFFEVRFGPEYPVGIRDNRLVFLNPDLPEPMDFNNIYIVDPELGRLVFRSWDEYGVGREHTAVLLEENLVRIESSQIRSPLQPGHVAVFQYSTRSSPGIVAHRGKNFYLQNLTFHHAAAYGGIFEGARNINIDGWQVVRRPGSGRWFTAHHDATHFVECRGDIHITNSRFEFHGDDDCNIHGIYRPVVSRMSANTIVTRLSHYQQMGVDTLHKGDLIGFHDAESLELLGTGKLADYMDRDVGQEDILIFEDRLPDLDWRRVVVTPRLHDTNVVISGNHFSNHRARSLLIKTLGKVRIFDNYFNAQGAAIKIRAEASSWFEAGGVEDIEIYNNVFDQCNTGGFSQATFEIHATLGQQDSPTPVHKNVRIHNNKIIQIYKPLLLLSNVENVEFYDNEIVAGTDYPLWYRGRTEPPDVVVGPGVVKGRFQDLDGNAHPIASGQDNFNRLNSGAPEELRMPAIERKDVICFALYTVHRGTLKLTAQLYPLEKGEERVVRLQVERAGAWQDIGSAEVIEQGWTAHFRADNWDDTQTVRYRLLHGPEARYGGTIRRNPVDQAEIVVAAFTGNSISPRHGGDISRQDLVDNVKRADADLLFFSGDQVYDHHHHYLAWLKFGRDFGEIIKDRPTITIPDDHDVGQPNLWGEYGKISIAKGGVDGGYAQPSAYVKEVERAQTSHLPDPVHPMTIGQGIGVYFTNLNWGNVDFAIIEDRKFKTGPAGRIPMQGPRPDHIVNPDYDPQSIDLPGLELLGKEQLAFLERWSGDWQNARLKVALSATIFCGGAHIHGSAGGRVHADMDSNGWPQSGRNRALEVLRKAFAFHVAGDQHLGTIFHHGIEEHRDAIWSFCVPSIANFYLRWWQPLEPGVNREPGAPDYTGDGVDGFNNKVTCYAAANPDKRPADGERLTTRAAGFGLVRLDTRTREITMECWPRNVDIQAAGAQQYPGWPRTIHQLDNFNPPSWGKLAEVSFDVEAPVVQLVDAADGAVLYTLRIPGKRFTPHVPKHGSYRILAGLDRPETVVVESASVRDAKPVKVSLLSPTPARPTD